MTLVFDLMIIIPLFVIMSAEKSQFAASTDTVPVQVFGFPGVLDAAIEFICPFRGLAVFTPLNVIEPKVWPASIVYVPSPFAIPPIG
jgi:hypothetical protein